MNRCPAQNQTMMRRLQKTSTDFLRGEISSVKQQSFGRRKLASIVWPSTWSVFKRRKLVDSDNNTASSNNTAGNGMFANHTASNQSDSNHMVNNKPPANDSQWNYVPLNHTQDENILCVRENCTSEYNSCMENENCSYALDYCTEDYGPENCKDKLNSVMYLIEPMQECHRNACSHLSDSHGSDGGSSGDVMNCVFDKCGTTATDCWDDSDCRYVLYNCTERREDEMPQDCEVRGNASMELIQPLMQCRYSMCMNDVQGEDQNIQCAQERCAEEFGACFGHENCSYVIQNCMDDDEAPRDCESKVNSSSQLVEPLLQCHKNECGHLNNNGGKSTSHQDMMQCVNDKCWASVNDCRNNTDCSYVLHNCTDESQGFMPEDCDTRANNSYAVLEPLWQCQQSNCMDMDSGGGEDEHIKCAQDSCPNEFGACFGHQNCTYVIQNCMDDDAPWDCESKFNSSSHLVDPLLECHLQNCDHLNQNSGDKGDRDHGYECALQECPDLTQNCMSNENCKYAIDYCMNDDSKDQPSDCEQRLQNASSILMPLKECHEQKCTGINMVLFQAESCLQDFCTNERTECYNEQSCGGLMDQLFNCTNQECMDTIFEDNEKDKDSKFMKAISCVQSQCFDEGDEGKDHGGHSNGERAQCIGHLVQYCESHPEDSACQRECAFDCTAGETCPCASGACAAVDQAPRCIRDAGICADYRRLLVQEHLNQGFYQPRSEWQRKQKSWYIMDAPNGTFVWSQEMQNMKQQCNALHSNLGDNIAACIEPSIKHCNKNEWDMGCRALGACGDSFVSWAEECDDGNQEDGDGCTSYCSPERRHICPVQGELCEKCVRDKNAGNKGSGKACEFCLNDRVNLTTPCRFPSCINMAGFKEAHECDEYVEQFCQQVENAGLHDVGCEKYEKQAELYTVPTIPKNCEYKIKSFNINGKTLSKVKMAIVVCKFADAFGVTENTTPLFKYTHPYDNMQTDRKKDLSADAAAILDSLKSSRGSSLIPLNELRISDFYEYAFPELSHENQPIRTNGNIAQLNVIFSDDQQQPGSQCHNQFNSQRMVPLPPSTEPLKWALKAYLMYLKWTATNRDSKQYDEFAKFDIDSINTGNETVNSSISFGMMLSQTFKEHDNTEREQLEYICRSYDNYNYDTLSTNPDCTTVEQNIKDGLARVKFDRNLFQDGCADDQCNLKVDHCRSVGMVPMKLDVDFDEFVDTGEEVLQKVQDISLAKSWEDLVQNFIRVSAAASSQAYDNTVELFNRLVNKGKAVKYLKNVPDYCDERYYLPDNTRNPAWSADPCCNWELRRYQCCAPKDIPNGEIDVVESINRAQISTYCQNSTSEVENLLQDLLVGLNAAEQCSATLEESVSSNAYDEMYKVKDTCQNKIYQAGDQECEKDSDCSHCSQSECVIQSGDKGTCSTPWGDVASCMLECFSAEMDQELVRYLKEDWNVSATASEEVFKEEFIEHMTEPACTGPRAWESDIGRNGFFWECNTTCTRDNICDDYDYQNYLQDVEQGSSNMYNHINFQDQDTCENYGGQLECQYEYNGECRQYACTFPHIQGACKEENKCYNTCGKVYQQTGCEEVNGTWIGDSNLCCPPGAHVYYSQRQGRTICSRVPEGKPASHELQNQACCTAENGTWTVINDQGQCCLGEWKFNTYGGQNHAYCEEQINHFDTTECYNECNNLRKECRTCRKGREKCCGNVYKQANETACLSYKQCTNQRLQESECNDPKPFCAKCYGKYCYENGQDATCTYSDFYSKPLCENGGGVWDQDIYRCLVPGANTTSMWDCLTPGPTICPSKDYNAFYSDDEVPKYSWRNVDCRKGCYLPSTDQSSCSGNGKRWVEHYANGTGVCYINQYRIQTKAECDVLSGTYVANTIAYNGGRFSTKEQCDEGQCRGSLGYGGWSREQCESSLKYSCLESCEECITYDYRFREQGYGACFSSNSTTCAGIGATPCIVDTETAATCNSTNPLQVEWKSCTDFATSDQCGAQNNQYAQELNCQWSYVQCSTKEKCEAKGQCDDWDNQRQECSDQGWAHGDTCYANVETRTVDATTNATVSTYESASCQRCQYLSGVCVEPRSNEGCGDGKWHRLGCKVYGIHTKTACDAYSNGEWHERATTKEQCELVKACKEPGRFGTSELSESECVKCDGELVPMYKWRGGAWTKPRINELSWQEQGSVMASVNEFKPSIADYRVKRELVRPLVKRFANTKKTQALQTFNVFSEALKSLACACGTGGPENCFNALNGSVSGESKGFCGLETPITAGCGTAVVRKPCPEGSRRRLAEDDGNETVSITWKHYSVGVYGKCYEPFSSSDDRQQINPLAVTNENKVSFGQLIGNGKGLGTSGEFTSVDTCFDIRDDIRDWGFDTVDIAWKTESGAFVSMQISDWISLTTKQACISINADGVYFPIRRINESEETIAALQSSIACNADTSILMYNATTSSYSCLCQCGYSGETCSEGCLNNCSNNGTCNAGTCECVPERTGKDCGEYNCPVGLENKRCSGQGLCLSVGFTYTKV